MAQSLIWSALGTGFAFLMTVSGAATVFLFREKINEGLQKIFLGFASGIMIAASVYAAAFALALGIGVQNFPEGAAVSLPLRQEGMSAGKAFACGVLSAAVEPLFGMAVVLVSGLIRPAMPWLLSFAAGAMIYVVVEELIPEANDGGCSHRGTVGSIAGFLLMMVLDVALSL